MTTTFRWWRWDCFMPPETRNFSRNSRKNTISGKVSDTVCRDLTQATLPHTWRTYVTVCLQRSAPCLYVKIGEKVSFLFMIQSLSSKNLTILFGWIWSGYDTGSLLLWRDSIIFLFLCTFSWFLRCVQMFTRFINKHCGPSVRSDATPPPTGRGHKQTGNGCLFLKQLFIETGESRAVVYTAADLWPLPTHFCISERKGRRRRRVVPLDLSPPSLFCQFMESLSSFPPFFCCLMLGGVYRPVIGCSSVIGGVGWSTRKECSQRELFLDALMEEQLNHKIMVTSTSR